MIISAIIYNCLTESNNNLISSQHVHDFGVTLCSSLKDITFDVIKSDYILFIKNDDMLSDDAIHHLRFNLDLFFPDILYSDEKIISESSQTELVFNKPDYSPDMIVSMNYFRNLLCVKTELLRDIKIESQNNDNALYEIVLKILPKSTVITHIREVLYVQYIQKKIIGYDDFFAGIDHNAAKQLLENYCCNNNINADVIDGRYHGTFRLKYKISVEPLVSIIIPFRDKPKLLENCVNSILEKTTYKNFEIIAVNNGSVDKTIFQLMRKLKNCDTRIQFYDLDIPFNYSVINNYAANHFSRGEHLLFLNNDTEVIEPNWIQAMLEYSQQPDVGIVGAKLLYPDNTIQHCGMVCYPRPEHIFRLLPDHDSGYFYFPHIVRNYHFLTFACVMVKSALFKQVGGLYEKLAVEFNDVDICARISALGYRNVYTPHAMLYHHESKSRGENVTSEQRIRTQWEFEAAIARNPVVMMRDTFSLERSGDALLRELVAMQNTLSWRITRPLRLWKKWLRLWKK